MFRMLKIKRHAQTFVEYTLLISIIVGLLLAMTPMVRRGIQELVRVVADQVGNQEASDQQGGIRGHLVNTYASSLVDSERSVQQRLDVITYSTLLEKIGTKTNTTLNLGFSEVQN